MHLVVFYLASFSFIVTIILHLSAMFGFADLPSIVILPLFLTALLCFFYAMNFRNRINRQFNNDRLKWSAGFSEMKRLLFRGSPGIVQNLAVACVVYAIINFVIGVSALGDIPVEQADGSFIGRDSELPLSADEVVRYKNQSIRVMSGHVIAFLAVSMTMMFPRKFSDWIKSKFK